MFDVNRDVDAAANDVRDRVSRVMRGLPTEADPPQIGEGRCERGFRRDTRVLVRLDIDARPDGLRRAQHRGSHVDGSRRCERRHRRRAPLLDAGLDRSAGPGRPPAHGHGHRGRAAPRERRGAGRPHRVAHARVLATHDGRPRTEQDFRNLVIERGTEGHLVRLGEVADVRLAAENERSYSRLNGVPGL